MGSGGGAGGLWAWCWWKQAGDRVDVEPAFPSNRISNALVPMTAWQVRHPGHPAPPPASSPQHPDPTAQMDFCQVPIAA